MKRQYKFGYVTGYINQDSDKTGYWLSLAFVILGSCLLLLLHIEDGDAVLHTVTEAAHNNTNRATFDAKMSRVFNFGDLDSVRHMSDSKIDHLLLRGDVNGNLQFKAENPSCMRRLSKSDSAILKSLETGNTLIKHPVSTLNRQATWHKLITSPPQKVIQQERDLLVIDQITSTV
jgi:hypothetical protein